jgi:chemotaxis protein MotB
MKITNLLKLITRDADAAPEPTAEELEIKLLTEEFRDYRAASRKKLESARKNIVYLKESGIVLADQLEVMDTENKDLVKEVEFQKAIYEELNIEKNELLDYICAHGIETAKKEPLGFAANSFEKRELIRSKTMSDEDMGGNSNWLMSYGDMMTLLLAVFIVLFALSITDKGRLKEVTTSISDTFRGGRPLGMVVDNRTFEGVREAPGIKSSSAMPEEFDYLKEELLSSFKKYNLGESLFVSAKMRGVEIALNDRIAFVAGDSTLLDYPKAILSELGAVLRDNPRYRIIVEGHTDDIPISNSKYPSNWELSSARASNVVRYFVDELGLDQARFSAAGFADNRPFADNSTPEGRAANRRVVIKLVSE